MSDASDASDDAPRTQRENAAGTGPAGAAVDEDRRALATWLWRLPVLLALGGGAWGAWRAAQVHFAKPAPSDAPEFTPGERVPVAPLSAFESVWDAREFVYAGVPAIAVRLPEALPGGFDGADADGAPLHLAAFSRVCTHQGCLVRLARDPEAVAVATNYRGDGPSLFCGCHLSVFAPLQGGRAVAGPAQEPLPRVRLELRDDEDGGAGALVTATGLEQTS